MNESIEFGNYQGDDFYASDEEYEKERESMTEKDRAVESFNAFARLNEGEALMDKPTPMLHTDFNPSYLQCMLDLARHEAEYNFLLGSSIETCDVIYDNGDMLSSVMAMSIKDFSRLVNSPEAEERFIAASKEGFSVAVATTKHYEDGMPYICLAFFRKDDVFTRSTPH